MKTPDELRAAIAAEGGPNYEKGKKQVERIVADMEQRGLSVRTHSDYCGAEARRILTRLGYNVEVNTEIGSVLISSPEPPNDPWMPNPAKPAHKPWWRFWA